MDILLDAASLHDRMAAGIRTVILDVRWALDDPHGREQYVAGHVPGAVYVDLETELAAPAAPELGRHPLPRAADFHAHARGWGINDGDTVVVYDDGANMAAARCWWLLRNAGLNSVALLDGGLAAWRGAGYELAAGTEEPAAGNVTLDWGQMPQVDAAGAVRIAAAGALLDARAAERYRGEIEPVDPVAGHIPGALSAPAGQNLTADRFFRPAAELRDRFARFGIEGDVPVGVYCGSGVSAAQQVAALEIAGHRAALYPGSWSQWSGDTSLPVATGHDAG